MKDRVLHIAASATGGDSKKTLDEVLSSYSAMGYKKFELYMEGRGSSVQLEKGAEYYIGKAKEYNITYPSLHLGYIEEDMGKSFDEAVESAMLAEKLNIPVVVFNTTKKTHYAKALKRFLKCIEGHNITPIVQIHEGRAIDNIDDVIEVLNEVNDPRVKVLHEVGSFHNRGNSWKEVCDKFHGRIGLVHIKDMIGDQSVPLGKGEIDLPALFREMDKMGYHGDYVVEMATKDRENTNKYIADALKYIIDNCN